MATIRTFGGSLTGQLAMCGWESGLTSEITATTSGSLATDTGYTSGTGIGGTYSLKAGSTAGSVTMTGLAAVSEFYDQFRYKGSNAAGGQGAIYRWLSGSTELGSVRGVTGGHLAIYSGTSTLMATGSKVLSNSTWYLVGVHIVIGDNPGSPNGSYQLRIDGADDLAQTNADMKPGSETTVDSVKFDQTGSSFNAWYDDWVSCTDAFPGDVVIASVTANGVGANSAWTPSSGNNYHCVDERPPSTADYVEAISTNLVDTYAFTDLSTASPGITDILAVQIVVDALYQGSGVTSIKGACVISGGAANPYISASGASLGLSYATYGLSYINNPYTGSHFTVTEFNAAEFGYKSQA